MLTFEDCVELAELTVEEIDAIAEHEHLTEMAALELGNYLVQRPGGEQRIKAMIGDDIRAAKAAGNQQHLLLLKSVLRHYLEHHCQSTA